MKSAMLAELSPYSRHNKPSGLKNQPVAFSRWNLSAWFRSVGKQTESNEWKPSSLDLASLRADPNQLMNQLCSKRWIKTSKLTACRTAPDLAASLSHPGNSANLHSAADPRVLLEECDRGMQRLIPHGRHRLLWTHRPGLHRILCQPDPIGQRDVLSPLQTHRQPWTLQIAP
jgi:hypothetical protein